MQEEDTTLSNARSNWEQAQGEIHKDIAIQL